MTPKVQRLEPQRHRGTEKTEERIKQSNRLLSSVLCCLLCVSVPLWFKTLLLGWVLPGRQRQAEFLDLLVVHLGGGAGHQVARPLVLREGNRVADVRRAG